jgi:hypothetical protein
MKKQGYSKSLVALRLFFVQLNGPLRDLQSGLERLLGDFGPAIGIVVQISGRDTGVRGGKIWVDRDSASEQVARFNAASPGGMPGVLTRAQEEVVGLFLKNCSGRVLLADGSNGIGHRETRTHCRSWKRSAGMAARGTRAASFGGTLAVSRLRRASPPKSSEGQAAIIRRGRSRSAGSRALSLRTRIPFLIAPAGPRNRAASEKRPPPSS